MNFPLAPSTRRRAARQNRAFTLIELLVVIAIISLLAAILFPVFSRTRENARRSSCISNLKQINMGLVQYVQDFDERLPLWSFINDTGTKTYGWSWALVPYVKSTQVYVCPSAVEYSPKTTDNRCDPRYFNNTGANVSTGGAGSYGYNYAFLGKYSGSPGSYMYQTHVLSEFNKTAETITFTEVTSVIGNQPGSTYYPTLSGSPASNVCANANEFTYADNLPTWHFGGLVVGFADGHVKWMHPEVLRDYDGNGIVDNGWYDPAK